MAQNSLSITFPACIRDLPNGTVISSNGSLYYIFGGHFASDNLNGLNEMGRIIDLDYSVPFSQDAVALLPTGCRYFRWGDAWLLTPTTGATPINLTHEVPGHQNHWVIQQIPYTAGQHFIHPLVISYNVSMSDAKDGKCPGADEPAFAVSSDGEVNGKISIVIEIMTIPPLGTLKSSSQVRVPTQTTRGQLATIIVREVEKALAASDKVPVAFMNQAVVQELRFQDLVLVDLVRMSKSTYQPTIALRVG